MPDTCGNWPDATGSRATPWLSALQQLSRPRDFDLADDVAERVHLNQRAPVSGAGRIDAIAANPARIHDRDVGLHLACA